MANLDGGKQIQATDPELRTQPLECETGEGFRAWRQGSPKPGKPPIGFPPKTPAKTVA